MAACAGAFAMVGAPSSRSTHVIPRWLHPHRHTRRHRCCSRWRCSALPARSVRASGCSRAVGWPPARRCRAATCSRGWPGATACAPRRRAAATFPGARVTWAPDASPSLRRVTALIDRAEPGSRRVGGDRGALPMNAASSRGFSLVELLVSMVLLGRGRWQRDRGGALGGAHRRSQPRARPAGGHAARGRRGGGARGG